MRLLILEILCGDESLISIFHFLCKATVPFYYSIYLPFLLSKKKIILPCSFILLSVFLTSNMSCTGSAFDVHVSCIVNGDFIDFRSFLIFSNNSVVNVGVHVNVNNYLNRKFYDHNFQSKPESNSNNFKPEILFSVFTLMFYHIFLRHNRELRIKIFEFLILISVLNVMKYFSHSEVYEGIKICSQLYFFTYESINKCDNVETSCLHSDLVFFSISKLQYRKLHSQVT